jgi:hypothetical protein
VARASGTAYLLARMSFVLCVFTIWVQFERPASGFWKAALLCFAATIGWIIWIRGFRLSVVGGVIAYRDGMYRTRRGAISDISLVKYTWRESEDSPRDFPLPRLLIEFRDGRHIRINSALFSDEDLQRFEQAVREG